MRKSIYLFLIIVICIMSMLMVSCDNQPMKVSYSEKTGLLDQNGDIVSNFIYTNSGYVAPELPFDATEYYRIFVPYSKGSGYHTVNYKDTNKLKQLWLDQIQRKGRSDGKVFAIRNRANDRDMNNFQKQHGSQSRYDYYYFKDNGDIVYKGGDKTYYAKEHLIKTFVGAVIVDYRTVKERTEPDAGVTHQDVIHHTGEYTVGAIYKMAINVNEARRLFADAGGGPTDGAYEFVAARKMIWFFAGGFTQDTSLFVRQFYNTNFMEVLVLNPYANEGNTYCLGVDSYYAYYGNYRVGEGATPPIDGFTAQNYPYMTDEKLYLAQRPETIIPLLNHTTTFTDASRWWSFLALPGHKY